MIRAQLILALILIFPAGALAQAVVGDPAPPLVFDAFRTRRAIDLAGYRGSVVVVHFFSTADNDGHPLMQELLRVRAAYTRNGVGLISVSLDNDRRAMTDFFDAFRADWPIAFTEIGLYDPIPGVWDAQGSPWVYVIGADSTVLWSGTIPELEPAVCRALGLAGVAGFEVMTPEGQAAEIDAIGTLFNANQFGEAVRRVMAIPPTAVGQDSPSAAVYADLIEQAQQFGREAFAEVDVLLAAGEVVRAIAYLDRIVEELKGTGLDKRALDRIEMLKRDPAVRATLAEAGRLEDAANALALAQLLEERGKTDTALARYASIARLFADLPEAKIAQSAVERLGGDDLQNNADMAARRAEGMFGLAESYRAAGRNDIAQRKYQQIIDAYPNTFWAQKAEDALVGLK